MKVVLFCGGLGMRLREYSESVPKPMVPIGYRPILWHIMKYYAFHGHKDFILCLGWRADVVKQYFLRYDECLSNDFVLTSGGREIDLLNRDIDDWSISFIDTGTHALIGERLLAVRQHLAGEEMFLANYTDGLSDLDLTAMIEAFRRQETVATFASVRPSSTFHAVRLNGDDLVDDIRPIDESDIWMNGGFFCFRQAIFDHIRPGEDLVDAPFRRLAAASKLSTFRHDGFWGCMDTFKEKQQLEDMYAQGRAPWTVWTHGNGGPAAAGPRLHRIDRIDAAHGRSRVLRGTDVRRDAGGTG